jgi:hypothetical protein
MRQKIKLAILLITLTVVGIFGAAAAIAQNAAPPPLKDQLEAQYTLTKTAFNSGQLTVTQPGTVLVVQLGGIQGVPPGSLGTAPAVFKDGVLHPPGKKSDFKASLLRGISNPGSQTSGVSDTRALPAGEKVYVTKLDVDLKKDNIGFHIIECDTCNGASQPSSNQGEVVFQFAKGSLANPSVTDIEDTIAKVFAIDNSAPGTDAQQAPAQSEQPAAPEAPGLTNEDVIRMTQLKLGDGVITAKIKSSACSFDTSVNGLSQLKQAGVSDSVLQAMVEAGSQPGGASPSQPAQPPAETPAAPACADYASCLASGNAARTARQYDQSLTDLQKATTLGPSNPDAWVEMGNLYLASGQPIQAPSVWDKALILGGAVSFGSWYYAGLHGYQTGVFRLSAKEVSFVPSGRSPAFSVAPGEVSSVKSHHPPMEKNAWSFGMKIGGHQYWFAFTPLGVDCQTPNRCGEDAGYGQEEAVANYVAQTIDRLALGGSSK